MPLIILTGLPNSGKTTRATELKNYFESVQNKKVEIISEVQAIVKAGYDKNTFYADSKKEKAVRNNIRSSTQHLLNSNDILILDGSNYIKGYRYELYCLSKSFKTPQCTVYCDIPVERAWLLNEQRPDCDKYSQEIFDALVMRYEMPDSKNRWDSPLFSVTQEDKLQLEEIYNSLYLVKPPKPNMSTQIPQVSSTNYLYELDRISQEIINEIINAEKLGITSDIKLSRYNLSVDQGTNAGQLNRLRRQFLTYSKMHHVEVDQIPLLFVKYLNSNM
ncbi:Similar to kti12: Protein KTI12 homolog (Xenopus laevis) [Cotesia congregata]|uniref:Protein KTI12 homolog n=1 Tax=Cotesia congregata TaxID=51543 RepID=A0A8J2HC24_COTCN|nr:Similar to kti12: Protein KTI12 homolog (Xenopus laevis) [Cotesia congregata]